jgi:hypothetical protein
MATTLRCPGSTIRRTPRNPDDFLRLSVLRAECNVSGVLREGRWGDGADLEAARMLLLTRFDLKLGLWDLALNPVLRSTVLDPSPPTTAPGTPIEATVPARERARRDAEKATVKRDAARRGVQEVIDALRKELRSAGWRIDDRGELIRPLTEPLSPWPDAPKGPLVVLRAEVAKHVVRVLVWHWLYNDLDLNGFVESRWEAFEAVGGLPPATRAPASVTLWSADAGWGGTDADWQDIGRAIAGRTAQWEALLAAFVTSCRDVRRARFPERRS